MSLIADAILAVFLWLLSLAAIAGFAYAWFIADGPLVTTSDRALMGASAVLAALGATFILCHPPRLA